MPYKKYKEKFVALIPARKGSKSIKNKNLYKISSKPLIHYTISASKKSKIFDQIFVSSDSKEILNYSENQNVSTIMRPKKYSNDFSSANDVVKHFINQNNNKSLNISSIEFAKCKITNFRSFSVPQLKCSIECPNNSNED